MEDVIHAARLLMLQSALLALLHEATQGDQSPDAPDTIIATLNADGIDIQYLKGSFPVGGEGF